MLNGKKKILLILFLIIIIIVIIGAYFFTNNTLSDDDVKTVNSVKLEGNGAYYSVHYYYDNVDSLYKEKRNMFKFDPSKALPHCSAFYTQYNGDYCTGRNEDSGHNNVTTNEYKPIVVFTEPKQGYKSICLSSTSLINPNNDTLDNNMFLRCPLQIFDGMNEKGLSVSILVLEDAKFTSQHTDKPDLLFNELPLQILEKTNNTDDAIKLMQDHDIVSTNSTTTDFHLFITDAYGNSKVVDFVGDKAIVTNTSIVTNHHVYDNHFEEKDLYNDSDSLLRYGIISVLLENNTSPMNILKEVKAGLEPTDMDALDLNATSYSIFDLYKLMRVKMQSGFTTFWSEVFNNSNKTIDICFDEDYNHVYHFGFN